MPCGLAWGNFEGLIRASICWTIRERLADRSGFVESAAARSSASLFAAAWEGFVDCAPFMISVASFCFSSGVTVVPVLIAARSVFNCGKLGGGACGAGLGAGCVG